MNSCLLCSQRKLRDRCQEQTYTSPRKRRKCCRKLKRARTGDGEIRTSGTATRDGSGEISMQLDCGAEWLSNYKPTATQKCPNI